MSRPTSPIQSEEYWFDDGDIVLSVTEDGEKHHFRVHRAILTIASPVFRDMFSMSQESRRECPLVQLPDDSIYDVNALMGSIYSILKPQIVTHEIALGIMRLSHKYQIEGLFQGMTIKLQGDWPPKYTDYLSRRQSRGTPGWRVFQAAKLIETAQVCQANDLLPTAFYELASAWATEWEEIAKLLSPENVVRLCVGRARVEQRMRLLTSNDSEKSKMIMWAVSPSTTIFDRRRDFTKCTSKGSGSDDYCISTFSGFRNTLDQYSGDGLFGLAVLQKYRDIYHPNGCRNCQEWFRDILMNKMEEIWENIPVDFDLPEVDPEFYSRNSIKAL